MPKPKVNAKATKPKTASFDTWGGKLAPEPTAKDDVAMKKNIAFQAGVAQRAAARKPKAVAKPTGIMGNITGIGTRKKLGKQVMGGK